MNNKIGVYICNYNKKEYVLKNLESLEKQTIREQMDIHVIDNASTDGAPDAIEERFGNVTVIRNKENTGGAGGFYQALADGVSNGYQYILLADNDIIAEENAVEELKKFLDSNREVGMVGSKIYLMDDPKRIWIYGNYIDFKNFRMIDGYTNCPDRDDMPEVITCDTVPSCFTLVRAECLEKTGYFPRDNFIFWDDIEWCYRFSLYNYKVCAVASSKVWHKTSGRMATNHFGTYYYNRNKLHFLSQYVKDSDVEKFIEWALNDIFTRTYGWHRKEQKNASAAIMMAFIDYLSDKRGKLDEKLILPLDSEVHPIKNALNGRQFAISVDCDKQKELIDVVVSFLTYLSDVKNKTLVLSGSEAAQNEIRGMLFEKMKVPLPDEKTCIDDGEINVIFCNHVNDIECYKKDTLFVDRFFNIISNESDYLYFRNSGNMKEYFISIFKPIMKNTVKMLRERKNV